ncbi:MAG: DNA-directed RNA polymerase subunit omega [Clostridiales bacterium]|nr:DNA-directed RNA polymerase subunit omega [Clostridiales bacterium]
MLKPSYAELMDIMNKDNETGDAIKSRYTVVIAAAKRARQIIECDKPMVDDPALSDKPLSIAVEELEQGKIKVVPEGMGTVIQIEKDTETLEEEIKNELEQAAEENEKKAEFKPEETAGEGFDFNSENIESLDELDELDELDDENELEGIEGLDSLDAKDADDVKDLKENE